jgi:uncharacterized protein (DUF488 family)
VIFTIGHSTRSLEEFVALLRAHRITQVADIRRVPRSRRHPHFSKEALSTSLLAAGIVYRHFADLGGLRKPRRDSLNTAWRHEGFRGYADYMEMPAFCTALDELIACASATTSTCRPRSVLDTRERDGASASPRGSLEPLRGASAEQQRRGWGPGATKTCGAPRVVIMCAEAVWWRCHRQLVADALVARGIQVRHITSPASAPAHTLTEFGRVEGERVTYRALL